MLVELEGLGRVFGEAAAAALGQEAEGAAANAVVELAGLGVERDGLGVVAIDALTALVEDAGVRAAPPVAFVAALLEGLHRGSAGSVLALALGELGVAEDAARLD